MVVLKCASCDNITRFTEGIMATVVCQRCGKNKFSFDGEYEFMDKVGKVHNTSGSFISEPPYLYSIKEIKKITERKAADVPVVNVYVPPKEEVKEEIKVRPKKIRLPRKKIK